MKLEKLQNEMKKHTKNVEKNNVNENELNDMSERKMKNLSNRNSLLIQKNADLNEKINGVYDKLDKISDENFHLHKQLKSVSHNLEESNSIDVDDLVLSLRKYKNNHLKNKILNALEGLNNNNFKSNN